MSVSTGGETRTVGRPPRLNRSARRQQLLEAAEHVFVAQGYHAAAMDDIAERAGVSKPVLYQHFPGKLDLYLALLDTHCDGLIDRVSGAMSSSPDNHARVAAAMSAYFEFVDQDGEAFRLVFESDLRNEPAVQQRFERVENACVDAIAKTIMEATGLDRQLAELLSAGLCGAAEIAARFWITSGRRVPKPDAEALLAALSWRGIASFPLQGTDATVQGEHGRIG